MRVRQAATTLLLAAVTAALAACSGTEPTADPKAPPPPTTYEQPSRKVRPDEIPLKNDPVTEGETEFSLIGLSEHMPTLVGSHTEFEAKGQFVRIRLVVVNTGRSSVLFDTARQLLVLKDGTTATPDRSTMMVKRQPDKFDLGATVRVEFDLYYDIPKNATPSP